MDAGTRTCMRLTVRRDGRILTIERSLSAGVLGPTKSGRTRRVTLGVGRGGHHPAPLPGLGGPGGAGGGLAVQPVATEAGLHDSWRPLPLTHAPGAGLGRRHAALHRLRHSVATYLVDQGLLLNGQARLGHRDPRHHLAA